MNFSKPSTVGGGGEISRVTSAVPSEASRSFASLARSSRTVIIAPDSVGRLPRQSMRVELTGTAVSAFITSTAVSAMLVATSHRRAPDDVVEKICAPDDVVAVACAAEYVVVRLSPDVDVYLVR